MTVPLLPRPKDPDDDWGQQPAGFFSLEVADVRQKLALMEHLAPEGIASPWAQLHFVNWMLEDQGSEVGREGVQVLKVVVLLQFLGYLEACPVTLIGDDDLGWLGPLLAKSEGAGKLESLILWKILDLHPDWNGQIFAGCHPANPFFPGARFYPDLESDEPTHIPLWRKVQSALMSVRGPETAAPLLDKGGEVVDPHLAASLSGYLDRFIRAAPISGWGVALRTWQQYLTALANDHNGQAIPVAQLDVAVKLTSPTGDTITVPFGIYPLGTYSVDSPLKEFWTCPQCEKAGDFWINFAGRRTVTYAEQNVLCPQHDGQLLTAAGEPINPSHYGAYPAPNGTFYVWTDISACPAGCTRHEIQGTPGADGMVIHWFNKQALEVKGRLVSLETVLLRNVAWMSRKERDTPSPVDIPVSGEYAVLVEKCMPHPPKQQWEIKFFGLRHSITHSYPAPSSQEPLWQNSTVIVWPPQDCPDWSIDYVAASTPLAARAGFRLVEKRNDNILVRSPVLHTLALYRTKEGKAQYLEVGEGLTDESFKSMGFLAINRPEIHQGALGGPGQLVLDFGTSNSAVLTCLAGTDNPTFVWSGVLENKREDSAYFMTFKEEDFTILLDTGFYILSPWNRERQSEHLRPFLPSLLANPQPNRPGSEPSIPPRGRGLEQLISAGTNSPILTGLKWKDWNAPGIQRRLESLLELLLLPAFWELRAHGCSTTDLKVTYPLAFNNARQGTYKTIVNNVINTLSHRTGLQVAPIVFHSESMAGSSFLLQTAATHVVAIDLGGGTTDFAIHVGSAGQTAVGKEIGDVLVADSFEYGGRDFLRAVVVAYGPDLIHRMLSRIEPDLLDQQSSPTKPADQTYQLSEAYVDCLEALLHRSGPEGLLKFLNHIPDNKTPAEMRPKYMNTLFRWEALLAGLLFYTRRIVEACLAEITAERLVNVSFNLLGQGWDLLRILGTDMNNPAPVQAVLKPRFDAVFTEIAHTVNTLPTTREAKTAVVLGARGLRQGVGTTASLIHPATADIRKTFVGMTICDVQDNPIVNRNTRLVLFQVLILG